MSGLIGWKAANNGAGKRIWFVMHEERVRAGKGFSYEQMYHCDKKGKDIRYSSYKTANQKAKELNDHDEAMAKVTPNTFWSDHVCSTTAHPYEKDNVST